jgi:hypothetical protein
VVLWRGANLNAFGSKVQEVMVGLESPDAELSSKKGKWSSFGGEAASNESFGSLRKTRFLVSGARHSPVAELDWSPWIESEMRLLGRERKW